VHLWIGIALSGYAVVIGLSGSALVFRDEIEHVMWPAVFHIAQVQRTTTMQGAVDRIQRERPGWVVFALRDFNTPGLATTALMRPSNGELSANYRQVTFNPYSGQVLLDRLRYGGWLGWMANLHEYLLVGPIGLTISGWMAVGLLVLCGTGLVLWWPGTQRWISALMVNPRARWKRLNWELHSAVGFWICAALTVVTITGIDFAFPDAVGTVVTLATSGSLSTIDTQPTPVERARVVDRAAVMTIDQAIEAVRLYLPKEAPAGYLQLPVTHHGAVRYKATGYYSGSLPYSELVRVTIDGRTGAILAYDDTHKETLGGRVEQCFTTAHFGSFGGVGTLGTIVKLLWVLVGIAPAFLAMSGLIMYWNRKLRPAWLRLRRERHSPRSKLLA
jgi:uncharacterized iron-regulated membrane protein